MTITVGRVVLGAFVVGLGATSTRVQAQASDIMISRASARAWRIAPAENFTGVVRVLPLFDSTSTTRASGSSVTFEPGARTAWHTHPRGQTLIVTAGLGRVQRWAGAVQEIRVGDVVRIPAGVKHWHGAAPAQAMTHLAVQEHVNGRFVEWQEPVTDAQYGMHVGARDTSAGVRPSRAHQLMGDIAPKLAQLTDSVLFGDVWARPGLAPRDRSLVTVSALIAMNRPDQLRSHLALALTNGVTQDELMETITHLAFYAGWPSAVTAVGIVRQVINEMGH
ncbi:MAG: (R)-mandelonitrile lyase [Gemmatimonadaceae bacterium]